MPGPDSIRRPGPGFEAGARAKRHAHRRSGAVTSVDLAVLSKELNAKSANASAPSTPTDMGLGNASPKEVAKPTPSSVPTANHPTPPASPLPSFDNAKPGPADNEPARERPNSNVSSETNESKATVRQTPTARNSGPPKADEAPSVSRDPRARPKTADASFMLKPGANDDSVIRTKRPISVSGSAHPLRALSVSFGHGSGKRKSRSGIDFPPSSSSDDGFADASVDKDTCSPESNDGPSKSKKRQRKVRSWAGAILTRGKGKCHHSKKEEPTPEGSATDTTQPPTNTKSESDRESDLDVNFDDDNVVVLRAPTDPSVPDPSHTAHNPESPSLDTSWKPKSFYEQKEQDDSSSALIDLDAALGPFNTPDMRRPATGTGFSVASRRMYSGGRRGEFVGPEMRYHRRTESAPEIPPFDKNAARSSRLLNSPSMENPDVLYEEEEEDASLASGVQSPKTGARSLTNRTANLPSADKTDRSDNHSVKSSGTSSTMMRHRVDAGTSPSERTKNQGKMSQSPPTDTPCLPGEETESSEEPKTTEETAIAGPVIDDNAAKSTPIQEKDPSTNIKQDSRQYDTPAAPSPDVSPRFVPVGKQRKNSSVDLSHNISQLSLHASPLLHGSRPDLPSSSCGTPRSLATPSTDRHVPKPSFKEAFADTAHPSAEDVPSLTSSASTMTNTMHRLSASILPRLSVDQSAPIPRRGSGRSQTSKRSSLVSLSKLVGHNTEKSKLSHEEKPPGDTPEKSKKGRRVSRLMQFWKSKDKRKSSGDLVRE